MVVIYRIYRITASAYYLVHHLAVAPFLLITQPTTAIAPAAIIALIQA